MRFVLIDRVVEASPERVVAIKQVTNAEEYLADHFPSFPILPGVFMLEALIQAARALLEQGDERRWVLARARALKYGALVRPGDILRLEVERVASEPDRPDFKGRAVLVTDPDDPRTAAAGRFELRPLTLTLPRQPGADANGAASVSVD